MKMRQGVLSDLAIHLSDYVINQKTTYGCDVNSLNALQPFIKLSVIHFIIPTTGTYEYTYMTSVHSYTFWLPTAICREPHQCIKPTEL